MTRTYFQRLKETTPTRLWVNNPTNREIALALEQGAVGCTTNPAFGSSLLRREPDEALPAIQAVARMEPDIERAATLVQLRLVAVIAEAFQPLWKESDGREGFVSVQGSPVTDRDSDKILEDAHEAHDVAPNLAIKIPATPAGLDAFARIVEAGYPTIITEVFSVDQLAHTCETYLKATGRTGVRPPFFISPITGIFGDHLRKVSGEDAGQHESDIKWAGIILARACQAIVEARDYPVTLLFGGARTLEDFTGLVGAASAATINYSTVAEIIEAEPDVEPTIHEAVDPEVIHRLQARFDDFRVAMTSGALRAEEFGDFGPVQHFHGIFMAGWEKVRTAVLEARGVPA